MKKIVWGMIGCGDVTEIKNGPGLYLAKNSMLKAVTNRTIEKAKDWVDRHQHGVVYEDLQAILNDPEIDIVYIATTPDKHMEYAIECAKAGKNCLIEKPLALSYEEGLKIKEAFDAAGTKAYVAFYRRSLKRFNKVKQLMDSGAIGKVEAINIVRYVKADDKDAWRMNPEVSGGNIFSETDIHILDYLDKLIGEIEDYNFTQNTFNQANSVFDSLSLNLKFKNGIIGGGQWLYNCNFELDRFEVIGENGMIRFSFFDNSSPIFVINKNGHTEYVIEDSKNVGLNMEQEIVDELNGSGVFSGDVNAALRTLKIVDKILK